MVGKQVYVRGKNKDFKNWYIFFFAAMHFHSLLFSSFRTLILSGEIWLRAFMNMETYITAAKFSDTKISIDMGLFFFGVLCGYASLAFVNKSTLPQVKEGL